MEEKKKRGRPKKIKLPDEVQNIVQEVLEEKKEQEEQELHDFVEEYKQEKRKGRWDVPLDTPIEYFDPTLSYELTGYKPINRTQGLDFDPNWFTKARDNKRNTGHYCSYYFGSKSYREFWSEEYRRCREGYTVNGYTITGDHYFFLNYYQLMNTAETKKAGEGRFMDFPDFLVSQYEYLHYIELCRRTRKNAALMKARGLGFSEMNASIIANLYSTRKASMGIIAASDSRKLTPTLEKVWSELSFLNDNTDGGFFKLRQVLDKQTEKRSSHYKVVNGQKIEDGWMSQIVGIVADSPNKIRGYRTDMLIFEEAGSWPGLKKAFIQGQALIGILGNQFGFSIAGGTGGDSGPALEGLRDIYYNPNAYNVLPLRHKFTSTGEVALTGYFLPAYSMVLAPGYIDKRGWTDPEKAKQFHEKERTRKANDPKGLLIYQAEFCFNAEEAFALEGDNKFNKIILSSQLANIRIHKLGPKVQNGDLMPIYKNGKRDVIGDAIDVNWIPNNDGKIHILEHPIWTDQYSRDNEEQLKEISKQENVSLDSLKEITETSTGYKMMSNLYVAGIDSIDMGNDQTSDYTDDPSKFCIVIKKRIKGLDTPKYVAYYMARPDKIRDAYQAAIKLMMYYNCRCNIEATRISMIQWAKQNNSIQYFMNRPKATYPDQAKRKSTQIGTPATKPIIDHQTDLIANFIEDYGDTIWFEEMLDQLIRYNDENKGKFDIVAAMSMAELADEELTGVTPKLVEDEVSNQWQDVGYYKTSDGKVHFGVINKKEERKLPGFKWNNIREDDISRNRTSNPMLFYGSV